MAVAKIPLCILKWRVDENCALRTCVQVVCEPGQLTKIDRLSLTHLRMPIFFCKSGGLTQWWCYLATCDKITIVTKLCWGDIIIINYGRHFHPVLSPSCVAENPRSGEGFQVFFECRGQRLQLARMCHQNAAS